MTVVKDERIAEACSILFGDKFTVEKTTIDYLQLSGINMLSEKGQKNVIRTDREAAALNSRKIFSN